MVPDFEVRGPSPSLEEEIRRRVNKIAAIIKSANLIISAIRLYF